MVYTYNGMLFSHKREGHSDKCCNMDELETVILSEVSQTEKDKYMILLICGI